MSNEERGQGKVEQTRGTIKEHVGRAIDNEQMEYEGKLEQGKGEVREGWADTKDNIRDATDGDR